MNSETPKPPRMSPVASWKHTLVMVLILLAIAVRGAMLEGPGTGAAYSVSNRLSLYASLVVVEILLLYAILRGIRSTGTTWGDLAGDRWTTLADVGRDVALGLALWAVVTGGLALLEKIVTPGRHVRSLSPLLPRGVAQDVLWVIVSIVAGIVEELVFRGYFQRQFQAATQSRFIGLVLQAILFGVSHGYQGFDACVRITLVGAAFGVVAIWRESLRPVMIAHAWTDIASGLFRL